MLITPAELKQQLNDDKTIIVSLCNLRLHEQAHIPNARWLERSQLKVSSPAIHQGKLPSESSIETLLSSLNLAYDKKIIAYDDCQGMWASRFLWTLEIAGFKNYALLNGGIQNWIANKYETKGGLSAFSDSDQNKITNQKKENLSFDYSNRITYDEIIERLQDPSITIWDARSADEFSGKLVRSNRGGHIPNAINLEWRLLLDETNYYTVRTDANKILIDQDLKPNKEIITYCQSHLRSSVTWFIGKCLGYNIRAYDGSWSEWGNLENTPIQKES